MSKYVPGPPQEQQNGLYWENERLIHETEEQLRLIREQRIEALKLFRAQEEQYTAIMQKALDVRANLRPSQGTG